MACVVVGSGAWGSTLAYIASHNTDVVLYTRDVQRALEMQETRQNSKYLHNFTFPDNIRITSNINEISNVDHVIFAVPSIGFRETVKKFLFLEPSVPFVSVTKGLEQKTRMLMSQVILDADPRRDADSVAVVSGPNLAHEISQGLPSATVVASSSSELAETLQSVLMTKVFRVYASDDVIGCEIGGVAKNVIAIAAGIGDGMGYGDNAKAAIMTRALAEITRLGVAEGGRASTFSGLAGIGDLIATCISSLSRNRTVGVLLGQGKTLKEIQNESHDIAEGVFSAQALLSRAREKNIEMPIVQGVVDVIEKGSVTSSDVEQLMTRPASRE